MRRLCQAAMAGLVATVAMAAPAGATTFGGNEPGSAVSADCNVTNGSFQASPGFSWLPRPQNYTYWINYPSYCIGSLNGGPTKKYYITGQHSGSASDTVGGCDGGTFSALGDGPGYWNFYDPSVSTTTPVATLHFNYGPGVIITPNVYATDAGASGGTAQEIDFFNPSVSDLGACTFGVLPPGGGVTAIPYTAQVRILSTMSG